MCLKKCSCGGIVRNYKGNTYAEICPKCKQKNSFVTFPNLFRSVTVEKPECFYLGNTTYLTVSGTGLLNISGGEVEGVFSLIMADTKSQIDRFTFEFFAVTPYGYKVALFISFASQVTVECCKHCKKKKDKEKKDNADQTVKYPYEMMPMFGNYARKVIFYPNGRIDEEDLLHCMYNR